MLITLTAVKGFTGLTNETVKILSLSMSSCSPDFCRVSRKSKEQRRNTMLKKESLMKKRWINLGLRETVTYPSPKPTFGRWIVAPTNLNSSYINPVDTLEILQFDRCSNAKNSAMTRLSKLTVPSHLNISLFPEISVLQIFSKGQVYSIFYLG